MLFDGIKDIKQADIFPGIDSGIKQNPVKRGLIAKSEKWEYNGMTRIVSGITMEFWDSSHPSLDVQGPFRLSSL
jgi:hypothetical protein